MTGDLTPRSERRRRRRWLVAVALVLMFVTAWWYWPRGDVRFVGKWNAKYARSDQTAMVTLHPHGRGLTQAGKSVRVVFPWRVENNRLIMGRSIHARFQGTVNWLSSSIEAITGASFLLQEEPIDVLEVTSDRIRARDAAFPTLGEIILERIPE